MKCSLLFVFLGVVFWVGFASLVVAAPPFAPDYRYPHPAYRNLPVPGTAYNVVPFSRSGIVYPLSASVVDQSNEYVEILPQNQIAQSQKPTIIRSRSGRYYTTTPIESVESYTTEPQNESAKNTPTLAPPMPILQDNQNKTNSNETNSEKIFTSITNRNKFNENAPSELDQLNARLAKMQLEKKNLEGTLVSIDKIKHAPFKVKTLVDLAEYVSRDKNYKREADHLFKLALNATDDLEKNRPITISIPKTTTTTPTATPTSTSPPKTPTPTPTRQPSTPKLIEPNVDVKDNQPLKNDNLGNDELNELLTKPATRPSEAKTDKPRTPLTETTKEPVEIKQPATETPNPGLPKTTKTPVEVIDDPLLEGAVLSESKPTSERPPLNKGINVLPESKPELKVELNMNSESKMTDKTGARRPQLLTDPGNAGGGSKKIPLAPPTAMSMEDYIKSNPPKNQNATPDKTEKTDTPDSQPETPDSTKPKKKPTRPVKSPLNTN